MLYRRPGRQGGLRRLYAPFVGPGDLVFDVGAHVGDRSAAFAALGARVIALEPQPDVRRLLERLTRGSERITVRGEAVGAGPGTARLAISRRTPTVSSLAERWRTTLPRDNAGFQDVRWDEAVEVPVTTLDLLIAEHGVPRFCKIDVEGYEAEVLRGLSRPLAALSFEFVAGALDVAAACLEELTRLGRYEYNAIPGEERAFVSARWMDADEMIAWLGAGAGGAPSGDVYARLGSATHG